MASKPIDNTLSEHRPAGLMGFGLAAMFAALACGVAAVVTVIGPLTAHAINSEFQVQLPAMVAFADRWKGLLIAGWIVLGVVTLAKEWTPLPRWSRLMMSIVIMGVGIGWVMTMMAGAVQVYALILEAAPK